MAIWHNYYTGKKISSWSLKSVGICENFLNGIQYCLGIFRGHLESKSWKLNLKKSQPVLSRLQCDQGLAETPHHFFHPPDDSQFQDYDNALQWWIIWSLCLLPFWDFSARLQRHNTFFRSVQQKRKSWEKVIAFRKYLFRLQYPMVHERSMKA